MRRVHWLHWLLALVLPLSAAAQLPVGIRTTNGTAWGIALLGTNTAIRQLSPVGGNNAQNDRLPVSNSTTNTSGISVVPDQQGQIGMSRSGPLISYLWGAGGTTTNSWTNGFAFPTGIGAVADATLSDPSISGTVRWYFNGNRVNYNQTGDSFLELANMSTNSGASGSGIVCARVGIVGGVPTVLDDVALGFQLVGTNSLQALSSGYGLIPFNNGVLGFMIASPGASGFDNGNYPYFALQRSSGLVGFPKWVAGAYTPETNTFRWALKADPATGNITATNGTMTISNLTEPYSDATVILSGTNTTIGQNSGTVNRAPVAANRFNISYTSGDATGPCNPQFNFGVGGWYREASGDFGLGYCNGTITTNIGVNRTTGGGANGGLFIQDNLRIGSANAYAASGVTLQVDGVSTIPTNAATSTTITTDLVNGVINTGRNQRFSVVVSAYTNATLSAAARISLVYSNATTGVISTNMFGIPAGLLASFAETNQLVLPDCEPNSKFWLTNGWAMPNSTIITYK